MSTETSPTKNCTKATVIATIRVPSRTSSSLGECVKNMLESPRRVQSVTNVNMTNIIPRNGNTEVTTTAVLYVETQSITENTIKNTFEGTRIVEIDAKS